MAQRLSSEVDLIASTNRSTVEAVQRVYRQGLCCSLYGEAAGSSVIPTLANAIWGGSEPCRNAHHIGTGCKQQLRTLSSAMSVLKP